MKLELKHLAPYLPYGLKLLVTSDDICIGTDFYNSCKKGDIIEMSISDFDRMTNGFESYLKPILRPLSDLTKEIEVNGEKFVPIVEIGKILGFGFLERFEEEDGVIEYGWNSHGMEDTQPYAFGYFEDGKFGVWYDCIDDNYPIDEHCSISSTNKLFEWHFDVFGLIEQGLAIDINTIKI